MNGPRRVVSARSPAFSLVAAAVLAAPVALHGQEVRGRFSDAETQAPLAGAYVTLRSEADSVLASTLTNQEGWFSLEAPGPGRYTVAGEYIGYGGVREAVTVVPGAVAWVEIRSSFQAIQLEGLVAEVDRSCSVDPSAAVRVAQLWDEVRKALQVTRYVEEQGALLFQVDRWTRTLEPQRMRVVDERRSPRAGMFPGSPFVSLPPEDLARDGYVREVGENGELAYYAPDAQTLLSPSFQRAHCFGFLPRGPEAGWVGLTFQPRDRRAADVEGTLWIQEDTYEPQRLDYRYPVLPWKLTTDKVGGEIRFGRVPEGPWIIRRWFLRMPVVQERTFRMNPSARSQRRYEIASLIEEGGEVRQVRRSDQGVFAFQAGVVEGRLRDADSGDPLGGADVRLKGTPLRARSDAQGRFRVPDVPEGRYQLETVTAALADLGLSAPGVEVDVRNGATAQVEVRVPSPFAALSQRCAEDTRDPALGLVAGTVRDTTGVPVEGARVRLSFVRASAKVEEGGGARGFRVPQVTVMEEGGGVEVPTGADGTYVVCGVPTDGTITVLAVAPGYEGTPAEVTAQEGAVAPLDLGLVPGRRAPGLVVRVMGPAGRQPLEAADVVVEAWGRRAVTDASGAATLLDVPVGPAVVTTSHLAYMSRTDTVDVSEGGTTTATVRLYDRAVDLEPIVVEVRTPEAAQRRAQGSSSSVALSQVDIREAITSARANNVAEVIRDALPTGVKIGPLVSGSNYVGTCIESTRGAARGWRSGGCRMVQVVVDGGYLSMLEAARLVENFPLSEVVSMEFLSPMEQTFRYGTQDGTGMLIIRTTRSSGG